MWNSRDIKSNSSISIASAQAAAKAKSSGGKGCAGIQTNLFMQTKSIWNSSSIHNNIFNFIISVFSGSSACAKCKSKGHDCGCHGEWNL